MPQLKDSQAVRENRFSLTLPFFLFRFSIDMVMPTHMEGGGGEVICFTRSINSNAYLMLHTHTLNNV